MILYKENNINLKDLTQFIWESSNAYSPNLSKQVDINEYSKKIYENSKLFEAYDKNKLIALVSIYINDEEFKKAYITYVYCSPKYRGKKITSKLIENVILYTQNKNYKYIELECSKTNLSAISLYKKYDFEIIGNNNELKYRMQKKI